MKRDFLVTEHAEHLSLLTLMRTVSNKFLKSQWKKKNGEFKGTSMSLLAYYWTKSDEKEI